MSTIKSIPCFRCGAPLAHGVADLLRKLDAGEIVASKAAYAHGDSADACGGYLTPGATNKPTGSDATFRKAVSEALKSAMAAEGYVRLLHVPRPVKVGTPEETEARALSAARNVPAVKVQGKGTMRPDCMFILLPSGEWADRATVAAAEKAAVVSSAPAATIPAPPPPPSKATIPAPPAPPVRKVHVATEDRGVLEVLRADAVAMLADGRAYAVLVNGAWADSL